MVCQVSDDQQLQGAAVSVPGAGLCWCQPPGSTWHLPTACMHLEDSQGPVVFRCICHLGGSAPGPPVHAEQRSLEESLLSAADNCFETFKRTLRTCPPFVTLTKLFFVSICDSV